MKYTWGKEPETAAERYRLFAGMILKMHRNDGQPGDVDGGWLQDVATEIGLLEKFDVPTDGCGEGCACIGESDYCYRLTRSGQAAVKAAMDNGCRA